MIANKSFQNLADYYDLIYRDKDYKKEFNFIEEIFGKNKPKKYPRSRIWNWKLHKNTFRKRI